MTWSDLRHPAVQSVLITFIGTGLYVGMLLATDAPISWRGVALATVVSLGVTRFYEKNPIGGQPPEGR